VTPERSSFTARVRSGARLRLLFVKMPCAAELELAAHTGFDAVIIDTEHGPSGGIQLEEHVRAADAAGIAALVRVSSLDPASILSALDVGATGIVVPHVLGPEGSRAAVAAAHYPPLGRRGLALSTRAGRYGTASLDAYLRRAAQETLVIVQIEDAEAVALASEILGVDGVDGVLIGATDLSISLAHPGDPAHPEVSAALDQICAAARDAHVAAAAVVRTAEEAEEWNARGAALAVFVSTQLMRDAFTQATTQTSPGAGDAVVLLPGMLATAELWSDVIESLGASVAVRGARIDLDDSVEEMADTVLASAPASFALAGHSLGAIVALAVVRRAPGRVSKLALLNSSARAASEEQLCAWEQMRRRTQAGDFDQFIGEFALANLPERRRDDHALIARITAMAREVAGAGFLRQLAAQRTRPEARPALAQIRCPTLVISSDEDQVCPPALQEELARGIPGARLERLAGCGHMSPLEVPERVAEVLSDWLA
jgi:4-hydroxy-2-oxoheptanedioate aldolase